MPQRFTHLSRLALGFFLFLGTGQLPALAQAPTVTVLQPARQAVAAPRSGPVTVSFSQPISAASAPNLKVYGSQLRGKRPGTVSGGGTSILSFAPTQPFAAGERVSVTVPNTLTSGAGTGAAKQVYQFTAATGGPGKGFFLDTTEVTYTNSRDMLLGDIDNDGDLDLLSNIGLFGMYSFLNNGQGAFTPNFNTVVGNTPSGAVLADVNQDGFLDLLAGDADNATVAIALNNGDGHFGVANLAGQLLNVGNRPVSVAAGDVDGDGDLDFASANYNSNTVSVGLNGGQGVFTGVVTVAVGSQPTSVQLADIDNDGDLDIITSNSGSNTVSVRVNNGSGSFSGSTSVAVGTAPSDLALADIDGDGDLDLITTNATAGTLSVRFNSGGAFVGSTALALPTGSTPNAVSTGDVDADGDMDLAVAQGTGGQVITFINNGAGSFALQFGALELKSQQGTPYSLGVTLGDVDGDLDLDVITAAGPSNRVIMGRDGLAPPVSAPTLTAFSPAAGPVGTSVRIAGTALSSTSAVRFNGATAAFVVNSNQQVTATVPAGASTGVISVTTVGGAATSSQTFVVTAGPVPAVLVASTTPARNALGVSRTAAVQATFASPISTLSANEMRVFGSQRRGRQLGTVSGAGTATLSLTPSPAFAPGERVSLLLPATLTGTSGGSVQPQVVEFRAATGGTGEGVYSTVTGSTAMGSTAGSLHAVDLDNDGNLDVVGTISTGSSTFGLMVRLNNGTGTFTTGAGLPTLAGSVQSEPLPADVDGDGDLDLLVAEIVTGTTTTVRVDVLLNDGRGQFSLGASLSANNISGPMRVGDLDADGDLDLAYLEYSQYLRVALNNGGGIFSLFGSPLDLNNPSQLRLGDLDNDGDLDVVSTSYSGGLHAALNNGQGQFTLLPRMSLGTTYGANMDLADLNGDGRLDVVTTTNVFNSNPVPVLFWAGLGNGQFTSAVAATTVPSDPTGLNLVDVNGDGNLDLVSFSGSGGGTALPKISVRLGNGTGLLQLPIDYSVSTAGTAIYNGELADFDGDGDLDVLYPAGGNAIELRLNQGRPAPTITAFSPTRGAAGTRVIITGTSFSSTRGVAFNGTPASSVMVLSDTQSTAVVPAGATSGPITLTTPGGVATSAGSFTITAPLPISSLSPARNANSAARNGNITLSLGQGASTANLVVRSNLWQGRRAGTASGAGTSTLGFDPALDYAPGERVQVTIPVPAGAGSTPPQVYDFTAATGGPGQGNLRWGGYANYTGYLSSAVGDFDEDGAVDIITQESFQNRLRILFNDGQGQFGARTQTVSTSLVRAIRVADINGDSHLDLVTAEFLAYRSGREINRVWWRAGTGTGSFGTAQPVHVVNGTVLDLAVGDLNADGTSDLAALIQTADSVMVTLNAGNGTFQRRADVAAVRGSGTLRLADLDNDGNLDLLTGGTQLTSAQVGRSMGTGTGDFVPVAALTFAEPVIAFETGDLDGDGIIDLVASTATSYSQGNVRLRKGDGLGNFGAPTAVGPNGYFGALRVGDFDADGDLDLATGQTVYYTGANILLNNGTGTFAAPLTLAPSTVPRDMTVADFNLDGSLDIIVGGDSLIAANGSNYKSGLYSYFNRPLQPTIAGFTPTNGPVGTVITLTGTSLGSVTTVTIGGVSVPFTIVSATQITITTTAATATGPIVVAGLAGTATGATFTVPVPAISSFTPASGAVQRVVTVAGQYFGGTTAVRFNGLLAPGFAVQGGTQLTVPVPAGATSGAISITTPSGTATSSTAFVMVPNPVQLASLPARHAIAAAPSAALALTYSQPIDQASGASKLVLTSNLRGKCSGAVSGGTPLTYRPTAALLPGEELTLSVLPGLLDQNGNTVLGNTARVLTFRAATGGTGRGALVADAPITPPSQTRRYLAADFTGDNAVDLLTISNPSSGNNYGTLYRNNGQGGFTTQLAFGSGEFNYLGQADLDEDGDLDIVGTNRFNGSPGIVQPLINDGQGNFQAPAALASSTWYNPVGYDLGDITGDGHIDLILRDDSGLRVYPGTGRGGFAAPLPAIATGSTPLDGLRLADLDNDGDLDALTYGYVQANYYTGVVSVLFNNGEGQLVAPATPPRYEYGYANLNLGDFDGDGDLDLMLQDNYRAGLAFYANDGAGGFGQYKRYVGYPTATSDGVTVGDVDADGDLDVLVGNYNTGLSVLRNTGNMSFSQPMTVATTLSAPIALADFDGDGDLDVFTTSFFTANAGIRLLRNGPIAPPLQMLSHTPATNALNVSRTATVRLNFNQALTAANFDAWNAHTAMRQGKRRSSYSLVGTATPELTPQDALLPGEQVSVSVPSFLQAASTTAGVAGARAKPEVFQYTAAVGGTGVGNFGVAPQAPNAFGINLGPPRDFITADFNDDGAPDIIAGGPGPFSNIDVTQMYLWMGTPNHTGAFTYHSTLIPYAYSSTAHMAAVDFDNDGDLEAAIVDHYGGPIQARLNMAFNTGNSFSTNMYYSFDLATGAYAIAFGDFDGDGDQDFALTRPQAIDIYLNARGFFVDKPFTFTHGFALPVGLAVGDLDRNGGLDLAVADAATGAVSVWYNANNDAAGLSGQMVALNLNPGTGFAAKDLKVADLDGDGHLDLAVLGSTGAATGEARLYRNAGSASSFAAPVVLPLTAAPSALAVGDLDHDGDLDLAITAGTVQLRLNGGSFGFSAGTPVAVGGTPGPLLLADFDTDGDLDFVSLSTGSAPGLNLRLNGGTVLAARTSTEAAAEMRLYPNPVAGPSQRVQVQVPGLGRQAASVRVYNALGQLVYQQEVPAANAGSTTLNLPQLAAGTYLLRLTAPDRQLSRTLQVE
ncbi:FG-GAP-like repeat-containing protein [Hymenobacter armeniacus]|uniref:VCBS repeat-containing protein n=1 Tax=Hymenobacter armeniacus TaxID=2771358 RepID=A0ABR8JVL1_9BACT|nr:FG-GAP-like repeat-containing protein [Hymenobacter armeniacus]MBD2723140.1 VCBS repeat-containing protein [Hymenobacter armeniacus]